MEKRSEQIIRTSDSKWLTTLARLYKKHESGLLIDDGQLGIDPASDTLLQMAKKARLSPREISAVLVSLGMSAAGIWMIVAAILDPEPTSKLGLLVGGGIVCVVGGGYSTLRVLTGHKPPNVRVTPRGIEISWN
jgi:hypothetical protein